MESRDSEDDNDDDDDIREVRSMSHAITEALREQRVLLRTVPRDPPMACVDEGLHEEGSEIVGGIGPSAQKPGYPGAGSLSRTTETEWCLPLSTGTCHATSSLTEGFIESTSPVRFHIKTPFEPLKRSSIHERFLRPHLGERRVLPTLAYREGASASGSGEPGCGSRDASALVGDDSTS